MSFLSLELKQVACIKTESSVLAESGETQKFTDFKPTKTQKVRMVSLGVPTEDQKRG